MKTERQKTIRKLDKLFSEYIRKRAWQRCGGCERAMYVKDHKPVERWQDLDCAHFHSRRKYSSRWHELNACGLCGGCHFYLDSHPREKIDFFEKLLGDGDFLRLQVLSEMVVKNRATDYKIIEIYLKQKIKELEEK